MVALQTQEPQLSIGPAMAQVRLELASEPLSWLQCLTAGCMSVRGHWIDCILLLGVGSMTGLSRRPAGGLA